MRALEELLVYRLGRAVEGCRQAAGRMPGPCGRPAAPALEPLLAEFSQKWSHRSLGKLDPIYENSVHFAFPGAI